MNKTIFITCVISLFLSSCGAQLDESKLANSITADELKEMLYIYASDDFEGRETGQPGQKKAVEFLKNYYQELDIPSAKANSYFQNVPLQVVKTPDVTFKIDDNEYQYYDDFMSYSAAPTAQIHASEIIFAGYGIDDTKYSDYRDLDVKNKIVVVKGGEPKDNSGNYILSGSKQISKWSNGRQALASKKDAAKANGAKALFLIDNQLFNRYSNYFKRLDKKGGSNNLSLKDNTEEIYFFLANSKIGNVLFNNYDELKTSKTLTKTIHINYTSKVKPVSSENVAAVIKGSEYPDEYIILSAHLDHLGLNKNGDVFNGADDDGSGTIALLEIAEAFKQAIDKGYKPKRSIVFLHVTGEEKGLLGSKYYTDYDPIFPLNETIVNLNIDMIGRVDPKRKSANRNYLYLIGSDKLSTELHNLSEEVNKRYLNIEFDYTYNDENDPNRYYYRSDHYNFAKNNIPVIFYFNGTHDDYHAISDTPDKIEYDLFENRTKLVFLTAWEIANRDKTLSVDKPLE